MRIVPVDQQAAGGGRADQAAPPVPMVPMAAGVTTRTTGLPGLGYREPAGTLIGLPGASCEVVSGTRAAWRPDRPDRAGFPVSRPGRRGAGWWWITMIRDQKGRAHAGGEPGIEAAGVNHRSSVYSPAAFPADTVAVDTVPSAT